MEDMLSPNGSWRLEHRIPVGVGDVFVIDNAVQLGLLR
jgi:hypothetical protein